MGNLLILVFFAININDISKNQSQVMLNLAFL